MLFVNALVSVLLVLLLALLLVPLLPFVRSVTAGLGGFPPAAFEPVSTSIHMFFSFASCPDKEDFLTSRPKVLCRIFYGMSWSLVDLYSFISRGMDDLCRLIS